MPTVLFIPIKIQNSVFKDSSFHPRDFVLLAQHPQIQPHWLNTQALPKPPAYKGSALGCALVWGIYIVETVPGMMEAFGAKTFCSQKQT